MAFSGKNTIFFRFFLIFHLTNKKKEVYYSLTKAQFYCVIGNFAYVAQLVEHFLGKEEVSGSNQDIGSIFCKTVTFNLKNNNQVFSP